MTAVATRLSDRGRPGVGGWRWRCRWGTDGGCRGRMPIHTFIYAVASGTVVQSLSLSLSILLFLSLPLAFYSCVFFFHPCPDVSCSSARATNSNFKEGGGPYCDGGGKKREGGSPGCWQHTEGGNSSLASGTYGPSIYFTLNSLLLKCVEARARGAA